MWHGGNGALSRINSIAKAWGYKGLEIIKGKTELHQGSKSRPECSQSVLLKASGQGHIMQYLEGCGIDCGFKGNGKQLKGFKQESDMSLFEVETSICSSKCVCLFSLGIQPDFISWPSSQLAVSHVTVSYPWSTELVNIMTGADL